MATIDMPIPSNYNPTGVNPGDPNNDISRLKNLQSFVPGADNSQVKVLGLSNTTSPFVPQVYNPNNILPSRATPTDGGGGPYANFKNEKGSFNNKNTPNIIVPLNPQGNGRLGVAGAGGYAPGMSNPGVPVATGRDYGVPVTVAALSGGTAPAGGSGVPASGRVQNSIPGAGAGTPAPTMGTPSNVYGYPTGGPTSGNGNYTGPTVGGGLDPRLHDELTKTYGDGFGNTLWNTLQSGAGFNPAIANAFIKEMQPIFQENLANAMEYFSSTGSRFSSAASLGAGKAVADFSAKQQAIFAQMYMWAYQNYLNVLQYGATNTGDNTFGNIRSILGLLGTAGKGIQGGDFGGTAGTIGDVLAGL